MLAGAARTDITPSLNVWMDGMIRSHPSEGIHDPLSAKALILANGPDRAEAFANFMPLLLRTRGMPLSVGAAAVFVFIAGTGIGALAGGKLAVVVDERRLTIATLLLASPLLLLAVTASGAAALTCLFLAGFMLRCADYVNIAQTQAIIPEGASMAAALGMGAAWGIAGLVAPLVGYFADLHGEALALAGSAALPLLGALVAFTVRFKTGG